ncbi:MAG: DUF1385 domain-containing protein [Oscillospiraceae bacterium]|nr:DUF1385 domain-containing protein [Oscillospiraceae bacterium]
MKKEKTPAKPTVGGEALMEGIMMRGPEQAAMAIRLPNGKIDTKVMPVTLPKDKCKLLGWPLIRGPVNLVHSMSFGIKCMMESAEKALDGIMEETTSESKLDRWIEKHFGPKMMTAVSVIGIVLGIGLMLFLFSVLPTLLYDGIAWLAGGDIAIGAFSFRAIFEGLIRVVLFVTYMFLSSLIPDIRRVFAYHGAEHKAIYAYEAELDLTVENVRKQSRLHPRCGTSFLFMVVALSILVAVILSSIIPEIWNSSNLLIRIPMRLLMIPILMALGYEFIRLAGRFINNPITRALSFPGMCMQRITTKEPDDGMILVGIIALKTALGMPCEELWMTEETDDDSPSDNESPDEPATEQ